MPTTLTRLDGRPDRRRRRRQSIDQTIARLKSEVEPDRISLAIGCHLIGIFSASTGVDAVVAELVRWAADPEHLASLGWPRCCRPWPWTAGEDVAVWHACKLLALVSRDVDGSTVVRRLDCP